MFPAPAFVQERQTSFSPEKLWKGSEPFLVGIAPNFWAHVPMTIEGINGLKLISGIHCWTSANGEHHVPVSKCVLVGCIVNASTRSSDGATLFVLDDGTGLIDCLMWSNNHENDLFCLPSLVPPDSGAEHKNTIGLGNMFKVLGKIQCVTVQGAHDTKREPFVIREILATMVERLDDIGDANEEARHWMACIEREASLAKDPTQFNALGYLKALGPDISQQVQERQHLPANDDTLGKWRIFGASCTCTMDYKEELLYCHCVAKVEPLDPKLAFRDALLRHLLGVQAGNTKKLVFPFKGIKINPNLWSIASAVISTTRKEVNKESEMKSLVDRLLLNTFRALRNDGVLYLANMDTDEYMLISRRWVLEPYIRGEIQAKRGYETSQNFINLEGASYLSSIHRDRLLYIKRCITRACEELVS